MYYKLMWAKGWISKYKSNRKICQRWHYIWPHRNLNFYITKKFIKIKSKSQTGKKYWQYKGHAWSKSPYYG